MSIVMHCRGISNQASDIISKYGFVERISGPTLKHPSGRVSHYFKSYWKNDVCIYREAIQDTCGRNIFLQLDRVHFDENLPAVVRWSLDEMRKASELQVRKLGADTSGHLSLHSVKAAKYAAHSY